MTPGAAQAARSASRRSAQDRTVPLRMTSPPATSTVMRFASIRSEEHTSELQSLMRNSYAVFCLKKKKKKQKTTYKHKNHMTCTREHYINTHTLNVQNVP